MSVLTFKRSPFLIPRFLASLVCIQIGFLLEISANHFALLERVCIKAGNRKVGTRGRKQDPLANRWSMNTVNIEKVEEGKYLMNTVSQIERYDSDDSDSQHIFWKDGGVHQNITFPVHPDPVSGMHCWHQKVKIEKAVDGDKYGDIFVDTNKSFEIYKEWLAMTRPAPGPGGLRRPLWMGRPLRPVDEAFYKK